MDKLLHTGATPPPVSRPGSRMLGLPAVAGFFGIIDGAAFTMPLLGFNVTEFYTTAILLKFTAILASRRYDPIVLLRNFDFLLLVFLASGLSTILNGASLTSLVQVQAFLVSLMLGLPFVQPAYFRAVVSMGVGNALLYIGSVALGLIPDHFGRFFYFAGSHPNLGSEIMVASAFLVLFLPFRPRLFLAQALFLLPAVLMQGRAAMLSIAASMVIYAARALPRRTTYILPAIALSLGLLGLGLLFGFGNGRPLNDVLLLDDSNRGLGSGASGRSENWYAAWQVYAAFPVFGAGPNYAERLNLPPAHNFFLYALASYGVFGVLILLSLFGKLLRCARKTGFLVFVPLIPMLVFNARFINLNLYPLAIYLILLSQIRGTCHEQR